MTKVILIHGNGGGTKEDNWIPYVKKELEKLGIEVVAETMPDNEAAHENIWLPFIKDTLKADENSVIVGHSSGAIAAMRYAEENKLLGSVLVGAYYTDLGDDGEKESGYFNRPWQWDKIKTNQQWIIQFSSTDDQWIPIEEARHIHEKLDTEYVEDTDKGHYGYDVDMKEFPELVEKLKRKLV